MDRDGPGGGNYGRRVSNEPGVSIEPGRPGATDFEIRPARAEDWPLIWPFFAQIVEAGQTYAYPPDLTEETGRGLWMAEPPDRTVVAVNGAGIVLGSAKMGPNRPGRGAHIGTASFMVDPKFTGRGVGRALGRHIVDQCRADGYHGIQFNAVVETNHAAVALWLSLGFQIMATIPEAFDHRERGLVGLHVMYQKL
jgi:L-amino acid N-acyltransferase YncA